MPRSWRDELDRRASTFGHWHQAIACLHSKPEQSISGNEWTIKVVFVCIMRDFGKAVSNGDMKGMSLRRSALGRHYLSVNGIPTFDTCWPWWIEQDRPWIVFSPVVKQPIIKIWLVLISRAILDRRHLTVTIAKIFIENSSSALQITPKFSVTISALTPSLCEQLILSLPFFSDAASCILTWINHSILPRWISFSPLSLVGFKKVKKVSSLHNHHQQV